MKRLVNVKQPHVGLSPCTTVLVTSCDNVGRPNIITISWIGVVCSDPPQLGISIRPSRYSYSLIEQSREFVVNVPTEGLVWETDFCGTYSGRQIDKFARTGLTAIPGSAVRPPLIGECPINLECTVHNIVALGSHSLFLGEVVAAQADEEVIDPDGDLAFSRIRPIVVNYYDYCGLGKPLGRVWQIGKELRREANGNP